MHYHSTFRLGKVILGAQPSNMREIRLQFLDQLTRICFAVVAWLNPRQVKSDLTVDSNSRIRPLPHGQDAPGRFFIRSMSNKLLPQNRPEGRTLVERVRGTLARAC